MILPIKHTEDWIYISQRKKAQIEKYVIHENSNWIEYNHRVVYQVLLNYKEENKYETPFKGPYEIFQAWKNITVTLIMRAVTYRVNICHIKPHKTEDTERWSHFTFPKINKWTCVHMYICTYTYIYIYMHTTTQVGNSFMNILFLFNIYITKTIHNELISIVVRFYNYRYVLPSN